MMRRIEHPKVGDRVSWWERGSFTSGTTWGVVVSVTKATATVRPDGGKDRVFRRSKYGGFGLHLETDAQRERREWIARMPRGQYAGPLMSFIRGDFEAVVTNRVRTAAECRAAALELEAFAAWLDAEPNQRGDHDGGES